eukprot:scaffold8170_cov65-Phaeocystis_antarctica.AAC.2
MRKREQPVHLDLELDHAHSKAVTQNLNKGVHAHHTTSIHTLSSKVHSGTLKVTGSPLKPLHVSWRVLEAELEDDALVGLGLLEPLAPRIDLQPSKGGVRLVPGCRVPSATLPSSGRTVRTGRRVGCLTEHGANTGSADRQIGCLRFEWRSVTADPVQLGQLARVLWRVVAHHVHVKLLLQRQAGQRANGRHRREVHAVGRCRRKVGSVLRWGDTLLRHLHREGDPLDRIAGHGPGCSARHRVGDALQRSHHVLVRQIIYCCQLHQIHPLHPISRAWCH